MSRSRAPLDQVLIYNTLTDSAFWTTPAQSWRLLAALPYLERVDPDDDNYSVVLKLAPPKPEIYPPAPREEKSDGWKE